MGLIYSSSDASSVINTLTTNLSIANAIVAQLNTGSQRLVAAVDGHTLSGAAYNAGKGLFSELIIPSIKRVSTAITNVQNDLTKFSAANSFISDEGYLDEDNLREQLTTLQSSKASLENSAHVAGTLANIPIPAIADMLREQQRDFLRRAESHQKDIDRVKKKIQKLTEFDGKTKGLFQSSLDDFKLAMQGVMVLNGTTVNSNGSYSLPKGTDKSWFTNVQKKQTVENTLNKVNNVIGTGSYAATANVASKEAAASLKKWKNGTWHNSKVKSTKTGLKTWKQVNGDVNRFKSVKNAKKVDEILNGTGKIKGGIKGIGYLGTAGAIFDGTTTFLERKVKYGTTSAVIDGTAHAASSVSSIYVGAAIGSLIPIPVVGTLVGAAAGFVVGNILNSVWDELAHSKDNDFFSWGTIFGN
ncbi:TPA: T7SS effector LXG polymorphic toxin [Enterococcus faecalis]